MGQDMSVCLLQHRTLHSVSVQHIVSPLHRDNDSHDHHAPGMFCALFIISLVQSSLCHVPFAFSIVFNDFHWISKSFMPIQIPMGNQTRNHSLTLHTGKKSDLYCHYIASTAISRVYCNFGSLFFPRALHSSLPLLIDFVLCRLPS